MNGGPALNRTVSKLGGPTLLSFYFVLAIAFAAIGFLLFDADPTAKGFWVRSDLFYVRLVWFEMVFFFAWFGAFVGPIGEIFGRPRQTGGVPIAIAASVCNAALLSMVMLFCWLFLPRSRFYDTLPIALQIIIAVVCIVKVVMLRIAGAAILAGMDRIPADVKTPDQLSAMLTICLKQPIVEDRYFKTLEKCKNKVDHSLPRVGKIARSADYKSLAEKTEALYDALINGCYDKIDEMVNEVEMLIEQVIKSCKI